MTLLVFLLLAALIFGIGGIIKGIFWLFIIGCIACLAAAVVGFVRGPDTRV